MIPKNSNVYLETSAVNFLVDHHGPDDGKATRIYHGFKGTRFYVSPVTIWEVLLTQDEIRRERLIYYLQNIAHHEMIVSPGELIINYINAGCPKAERKYKLHSKLPMAEVWSDICENPAKSIRFGGKDIKQRSDAIRVVFKTASKLIEDVGISNVAVDQVTAVKIEFDRILNNLKGVDISDYSQEERKVLKISLVLLLLILCGEVNLEDDSIKDYWNRLGVDGITERFYYLISKQESLIYEGPFVVLAQMVNIQMSKGGKSTRGIFWDALHSIYLIYCEVFLTADAHFRMLRETGGFLYKKISYLPESRLYTARTMDIHHQGIIR